MTELTAEELEELRVRMIEREGQVGVLVTLWSGRERPPVVADCQDEPAIQKVATRLNYARWLVATGRVGEGRGE